MAEGASLVCSVESTRWPVSAAWIAISAVSRSRISPTMMMSGSCRISARTPSAKVRSSPVCICIWLNAGSTISMGSSSVQTFTSGVARLLERGIQRGGLAGTGGAGDEDDAVGLRGHVLPACAVIVGKTEFGKIAQQHFRIEDAHHQLFAESGGQGGKPQFDLLSVLGARLDAPILRAAFLHQVHAPQQLDAAGHRGDHRHRQLMHLMQHAVDAEAHDAEFAARLDMDIRCALVERVLPQPVHDMDDVLVVGVELLVGLAQFDQLLERGRVGVNSVLSWSRSSPSVPDCRTRPDSD